jgi:sulfur carrier protein ThiS
MTVSEGKGFMELTVKLVSNKSPYRVFGVVGAEPLHGRNPTVEERKVEVLDSDTYEKVLEKLNINLEEVLVLRNGKPVPEDEQVAEKKNACEEITIIRIISEE